MCVPNTQPQILIETSPTWCDPVSSLFSYVVRSMTDVLTRGTGTFLQVFCCDGLVLPVNSNQVDACICIAVIHHYSTIERRSKAIAELLRVTKPGGKVLISVWALEQEYKR